MIEEDQPRSEGREELRPEVHSKQPAQKPNGDGTSKGSIQEIFAGMMQYGPPRHPLADKLTGEHLTEILSIQRQGLVSQQADREHQRKHHRSMAVIACVFVLGLTGLLLAGGQSGITERVILSLISLAAVAFGGYGLGTRKRD
jgi:hypothetical protein